MDLNAINCQPKVQECNRAMSAIAQIACVMVDQKMRGEETN
jgi:hypothetical protein